MKKWYKSKTVWVNTLTLVAGVFGLLSHQQFLTDHPVLIAALVVAQGFTNLVLRFISIKQIKL